MRILYSPSWKSQQRQFEKKDVRIYPVRLAMEATYIRNKGHYVVFDKKVAYPEKYDKIITEPEGIPFELLPSPDRDLTRAFDKKYQDNGNYKYHPGAYILSAGGCWWGKCSFCVEKYDNFMVREVSNVIQEIGDLYFNYGVNEIFDDSATFPDGSWMREFCNEKTEAGLGSLPISCNMRIDADIDFKMMKQAGFRMILFGVESANQKTLNRINKGIKSDWIIPIIQSASRAGLEPHVAVMFGYPLENDDDSKSTLDLVYYLLKKGYAKTAQASFYKNAGEESNESQRKYIKKIYDAAYSPEFWFNKILSLKNIDDIKYLLKQIKVGIKEKND